MEKFMPRLLLVDQDRFVLRALEKLLTVEGFYCQPTATAEEAKRALQGEPFDAVILDVCLPDLDGFNLCRQIRMRHRMPILFLTSRDDCGDKVVGLEVGGDDYLTKPFAPRELVARVRAQLRRAGEYNEPLERRDRVTLGGLTVDAQCRDAFCDGKPAKLTDREFELLALLARHREKALATDWIFQNVWGFQAGPGLKTLAVTVRRLRCKIEANPENPRYLHTLRGFGYKLSDGGEEEKGE